MAFFNQATFYNPHHQHFASVNLIPSDSKQLASSNSAILHTQAVSKEQSLTLNTTKTHVKTSAKKVPIPSVTATAAFNTVNPKS
jgi:hypothetical protein